MYEISKLINQVISGNKQRKREIVLGLGYKNLDKGYSQLYHLIESGECPELMRKMLPTALGVEPQVVEDAFRATSQQIAEEVELDRKQEEEYERRIFKPHLWIEHELSRPRSIAMTALSGINSFKLVKLPEGTNQLSWNEQKRVVRWAVRHHQQNKGTEDCMFGKVTGYVYRQTYDDSHLFSKDGKLLETNIDKFKKPESSLKIGGKEVSSELMTKVINRKPKVG
jgi:hypothetical protein